jgi:hypothetical protein
MGFTLRWAPDGGQLVDTRLVVRMEPAESVNATSRLREFEVLREMEGVVPVPHAYGSTPRVAGFRSPHSSTPSAAA